MHHTVQAFPDCFGLWIGQCVRGVSAAYRGVWTPQGLVPVAIYVHCVNSSAVCVFPSLFKTGWHNNYLLIPVMCCVSNHATTVPIVMPEIIVRAVRFSAANVQHQGLGTVGRRQNSNNKKQRKAAIDHHQNAENTLSFVNVGWGQRASRSRTPKLLSRQKHRAHMHGASHQTSRKPSFTNQRPVINAAPGSVSGRGLAVAREECTAGPLSQSAQHQCRSAPCIHVSTIGKHHQLHQSRVLLPGSWQRRFCLSVWRAVWRASTWRTAHHWCTLCCCCRDITVKASQHGQFLKEVCPGETYTLTVSFGEQERAALVTVSGGTLQEANVAGW